MYVCVIRKNANSATGVYVQKETAIGQTCHWANQPLVKYFCMIDQEPAWWSVYLALAVAIFGFLMAPVFETSGSTPSSVCPLWVHGGEVLHMRWGVLGVPVSLWQYWLSVYMFIHVQVAVHIKNHDVYLFYKVVFYLCAQRCTQMYLYIYIHVLQYVVKEKTEENCIWTVW